jgi:predicted phage-related endonuclease
LALKRDLESLLSKLEQEKDHVLQKQDMTNRILATRIELDKELSSLKKQYAAEVQDWNDKLLAEKIAHKNDVARLNLERIHRKNDVAKAQTEINKLKQELNELSKERTNLASLVKQSIKVILGLEK